MAKNKFTEEQTAALEARGKTIVSASAGSGKTTVMIEKIVRLILGGANVSEILAVTFTKKAAQQMKDKLKNALVKAINSPETPVSDLPRLKKQLSAAQSAEFSTIHSFCANLIRTHYFAAGTGGDFSIMSASEAQGRELQLRALTSLFEEAYVSNDPDFQRLLSVFFRKKRDGLLKKVLMSAYASLRDKDNYKEFLSRGTVYTEERFDAVCAGLLENFRRKCRYFRRRAEEEREYFTAVNANGSTRQSMDNATFVIAAFLDFENTQDYFALKDVPKETGYTRKQAKSKTLPPDFEKHAAALADCKAAFDDLHKKAAEVPVRAKALEDYLEAGKVAQSIAKYVLLFEEKYNAEKREKNVLDYNDLEHIALSLLGDEAVREELRQKYPYVFVDEYQDVNPVQERLLSAVGGENVFLVGDVKQAIYGFRGSRSEYFAKKRGDFAAEEGAYSLSMNSNFRSAPAILNAVNEIFSEAMREDTSFVNYAEEGVMQEGAKRYKADGRVCFHLAVKEKRVKPSVSGVYSVFERSKLVRDEKFNALTGRCETGDEIARIVKEELQRTYYDPDTDETRQIGYGDIAVLVRKNRQPVTQGIIAAFTFEDIPFSACSPVCLDDYPEIRMAKDLLSYIDNAEQDVPLCSALCSPAGNFLPDELAAIRLAYPEETAYRGACRAYAREKSDDLAARLRAFFAYFSYLRDLACVAGAEEVLTRLFADCGAEAGLLARKTGKECLKRLHYFLSFASDPEPLSVHEFLAKLKLMKGEILYEENAGENVVKILTMHSSKGLEYPVVILGDACDPFRGKNDRGEFSADSELGVAARRYDVKNMVKRETLLRDLIEEKKIAAERADELNVFYVALTRAKFALHVVFGKTPPPMNVLYANTYAEFIPAHVFEEYLVKEQAEEEISEPKQTVYATEIDETLENSILCELQREYPFAGGENLPVKQSATAVMSEIEAAFSGAAAVSGSEFSEEENFSGAFDFSSGGGKNHRLTGLAFHAFLQYADFALLGAGGDTSAELVNKERARMRVAGFLSAEYDALLDSEKLASLLKNQLFARFAEVSARPAPGAQILRERNFLVALPVKDVYFFDPSRYGKIGNETTLFQGAADLLLLEKDRAHIVDYKFSSRDENSLRKKYTPQLKLYRKAVAKISGIDEKNVRCTILNLLRGYSLEI